MNRQVRVFRDHGAEHPTRRPGNERARLQAKDLVQESLVRELRAHGAHQVHGAVDDDGAIKSAGPCALKL